MHKSPISKLLSQKIISAIYRDKQGVLWIGTQGGLHRFDGAKVTLYNSAGSNKNWIPANDIRDITEDANGNLLIATMGGGLLRWSKLLQQFETLATSTQGETNYLRNIYVSKSNGIWLGTRDEIFLYKSTGHGTELVSVEIKGKPLSFIEDEIGDLIVGSSFGLEKISRNSNSVVSIPLTSSVLPERPIVTAIDRGPNENLIIGTNTGHLAILDKHTYTIMAEVRVGDHALNYISGFAVYKKSIYVATSKGLFVTNSKLTSVVELSDKGTGLSNADVFRLFSDKDIIWVGTFGGLDILFFPPFELFNIINSAIPNDVHSFGQDRIGRIWVGTDSGLYLYNEKSKSHSNFDLRKKFEHSTNHRVTSIANLEDKLWLGFYQGGVEVIDTLTGESHTPNFPNASELAVTKILTNPKRNEIWIATYDHGLFQIDHENSASYNVNIHLRGKRITQIFLTQGGDLLAVSGNNIHRRPALENQFSALNFDFQLGAKSPAILTINQSSQGDIYLGTDYHGLYVWTYANQSRGNLNIQAIGQTGNLNHSSIYGIEFDSAGNLWHSTQDGIVKLNPHGEFLDRFSTLDGLQDNDYTSGSSFTTAEGIMYFGGEQGYNRFNPNDIEVTRPPPSMLLTAALIPGEDGKQLSGASDLTSIQLTHRDKFVKFEFSVLDFFSPDRNEYRYMLTGFDSEWIENGAKTSATYTNLPPGNFLFRVQGANSAGTWNRKGLSTSIEVLPPPWLTWWAYSFYALLSLLGFWGAHRIYRSYAIDRKAIKLAHEMYEAEERADDDMQEQIELQDDIIQSAYQYHLGTLSLINDFVREGSEHDDLSSESVTGSRKRLSALASLEDCIFYHAGGPAADLNKYTEIVLSKLLAYAPVNPETIVTINEIKATLVPAVLASPLSIVIYETLENCIQHAFHENSPANYIQISLTSEQNELRTGDIWTLTVRDNGMGIPKGTRSIENGKAGLAIIEGVVSKLKGSVSISNESGTTVQVTLPFDTTLENPPR